MREIWNRGLNELKIIIYELLTDIQIKHLETKGDLDCAYTLPGVARFRINVYKKYPGWRQAPNSAGKPSDSRVGTTQLYAITTESDPSKVLDLFDAGFDDVFPLPRDIDIVSARPIFPSRLNRY